MIDIYTESFLQKFWENSEYSRKKYEGEFPTDEIIDQVESQLGYRLPKSYISFMKFQNGGIPNNTCIPTKNPTSWANDHIQITGIYSIGSKSTYSLLGKFSTSFWVNEWGYPEIGIVICDCPSAGHDLIFLDYSICGKNEEPPVVHIDQELDYKKTILAKSFEEFIQSLVNESIFDTSGNDKIEAFKKVEQGKFSDLLYEICQIQSDPNRIEKAIRRIAINIVEIKGFFGLHFDDLSLKMYDILLYLYIEKFGIITKEKFLEDYPKLIVFNGDFSTGGYAPDFIRKWLESRIEKNQIVFCFDKININKYYKIEIMKIIDDNNA